MLALAFFTPVLGEMALKFGAYEFFWLAVFGVVISGNLTGNDPLKGWMAGFLGAVHRRHRPGGDLRATTASPSASTISSGGISLVPALVGAFGLAEVLTVMKDKPRDGDRQRVRHRHPEDPRRARNTGAPSSAPA